jgi:hypothetical protein
MKNAARHEIVVTLTPEKIEQIRCRNRLRKIQIGAAEFAAEHHSQETGVVDLGDIDASHVVWEHWRIIQSQYHYREPGKVDLGEIG